MSETKVFSTEIYNSVSTESQVKNPIADNETKFIAAIFRELANAKEKFPVFCDDFTEAHEDFILDELKQQRKVNSSAPYCADDILNEEILEAISAYQCGDFENCMVELAQCGAVIMRMMEFVQNKMDEELKNTLVLDLVYYDFNTIYYKAKNEIKFPVENREIARLLIDEAALAKEFWSCKDEESNITCGQLVKKHIKKYDKVLFKCDSRKIEFKNPKITTWLDYRDRNFFVITWEEM